ncbi:MAG: hypothetical protein H6700_02480 [Myxococcales bacterium]|nr:hypothetical protein [Myxococcales bacterium]
MAELGRYRGTTELSAVDVSRVVRQLLRETPELASRDPGSYRHLVDESVAACDGYDATADPAGAGYWQILGAFSATLLRIAGANAEAAISEVAKRDAAGLELLMRAVLVRMAQLAERGEPSSFTTTTTGRALSVPPATPGQPGAAVGTGPATGVGLTATAVNTGTHAPMASVPGMASPLAGGARAASNAPLAYLLGLLDAPARSAIRGFDAARYGEGGTGSGAPPVPEPDAFDDRDVSGVHAVGATSESAEADDERAEPVQIAIADGVALSLRPEGVAALRDPAARAALLRAVAAGIERLIAQEKGR